MGVFLANLPSPLDRGTFSRRLANTRLGSKWFLDPVLVPGLKLLACAPCMLFVSHWQRGATKATHHIRALDMGSP
jgi:hypothetical protein